MMTRMNAKRESFDTHYVEFVETIRECKPGKWLREELERADRIHEREQPFLHEYLDLKAKRILDFGCGTGASSVVWARMGAREVAGIEPDLALAEAARVRIHEDDLTDRIHVYHVADTAHLPFEDNEFEVCICNAVLEHIPPRDRSKYIREIWRVVAPGGCLYITETPNAYWPRDTHTTKLWLVPYMPLPIARWYAIRRGRAEPDVGRAELLSRGIRGATYYQIARALRGQRYSLREWDGDLDALYDFTKRESTVRRFAKRSVVAALKVTRSTVCRFTGIPIRAFMPGIRLCLVKDSVG